MKPSARRAKPKARLNAYEALLAEERNVKLDQVQIHIPAGPRLGDVVVEAKSVRKSFADKLLIDDLSFSLPPAAIVGVIGPNGAGKTTLVRMITGEEHPDEGTFQVGETVALAYVDQSREALDAEKTVWEEVSGGLDQMVLGERTIASRAYVAGFNFKRFDRGRQHQARDHCVRAESGLPRERHCSERRPQRNTPFPHRGQNQWIIGSRFSIRAGHEWQRAADRRQRESNRSSFDVRRHIRLGNCPVVYHRAQLHPRQQ